MIKISKLIFCLVTVTVLSVGCSTQYKGIGFGGGFSQISSTSKCDKKAIGSTSKALQIGENVFEKKDAVFYRDSDSKVILNSNGKQFKSKSFRRLPKYIGKIENRIIKKYQRKFKKVSEKEKKNSGSDVNSSTYNTGVFFGVIGLIIFILGMIMGSGKGWEGLMIMATYGGVALVFLLIGLVFILVS